MRRSSASIGLVLIGTTLAALGFDAYQTHKSTQNNFVDSWPDDDFSDPTTRPSSSSSTYHGTHFYHGFGSSFFGSDTQHHSSSSIGRSSSSSHSSTSRGGFGSTGHSGGS